MELSFEHRFAAPIADVLAMFANEDFCRVRAEASGAIECDVLVDGKSEESFTTLIRRTLPTERIRPDFVPLVGKTLSVRYTEVWEEPAGDDRSGTFAVEIVGAPARASGSYTMTEDRGETVLSATGAVTATLPFLAHLITEAIVKALTEATEAEFAAGDEWLARA